MVELLLLWLAVGYPPLLSAQKRDGWMGTHSVEERKRDGSNRSLSLYGKGRRQAGCVRDVVAVKEAL